MKKSKYFALAFTLVAFFASCTSQQKNNEAQEVVDKVSDKIEDTKENIEDVIDSTKEDIKDISEEAKEKAEEVIE